ncbi:hypothetical protein E2562_031968 [Oryza meyeriana var. granulata]|uniref:Uncharacterized protein n=1 Tax=Oryza meyeriana var. granulata TaxID=110450 RepID=A0A6G1ERY7_9ORYZ|nr:hypothetical protein E2562_031968 [Oryza meyeriana var. granulata]
MAANPVPHALTTPLFPRPLPPVLASNHADRVTAATSTFLPHSSHLPMKPGTGLSTTPPRCHPGQRPFSLQIRLTPASIRPPEGINNFLESSSPFTLTS